MKTILTLLVISLSLFANARGAFVASFVGPGTNVYTISDPPYSTFATAGWNPSGSQTGHTTTAAWGSLRTSVEPGQLRFLNFAFAAPDGQNLTIGLYQTMVSYVGNQFNQYRMDISGDGIPLNTASTGWFKVIEVEFGNNSLVSKAAIDFSIDKNLGTLRYNSIIPLATIPEPGAPTLLMSSLLLLWRRRR